MSVYQLRQTAHFGSLFPLAQKIANGAFVPSDVLRRYEALAEDIPGGGYCRSDIVDAGGAVVLANLDRYDQAADYDAWARGLAKAEVYFRHAISCIPTNAGYWLRLAAVRRAIAENSQEIAELMRMSVTCAPADQDMIIARLNFWNMAGAQTLAASRSSVESDVRTVLTYGNAFQIMPAIGTVGPDLMAYFEKIARFLPAEKLATFRKAGLPVDILLRSTPGKSAR